MRALLLTTVLAGALAAAGPAAAYWSAEGDGLGSLPVGTVPNAPAPEVSADARTITVNWEQVSPGNGPLGGYSLGGYLVRRVPAGGGAAVVPGGGCGATINGSAPTLSCSEPGVPLGAWRYTLTTVLGNWTGEASPPSAVVESRLPAPSLTAVTALDPAGSDATGAIEVVWSAVAGATGYDVFRRIPSGTYDYASPVNGATPVTGSSFTDPATSLTAGTAYRYVVRASGAGRAGESVSSTELGATAFQRPAAPTGLTATAAAAGAVTVAWNAVAGAAGYNVYRRTTAGSFDYSSPRNGATPVSSPGYTDAGTANGTPYRYVVRAVVAGSSTPQIEGAGSSESAIVTADSVAPAPPLAVTVGAAAGPLLATATCTLALNTRFVNAAGQAAVPVSVAVAAVEPGVTSVITASTPGSPPVTAAVAQSAVNVTSNLDLSALADGVVTLSVRSRDAAGNLSAAVGPVSPTRKDTVVTLGSLTYTDNANATADRIIGASECGARITAVQTVGPRAGRSYGPITVPASGAFSLGVDGIKGTASGVAYTYTVTAGDLASNSRTTTLSGLATR